MLDFLSLTCLLKIMYFCLSLFLKQPILPITAKKSGTPPKSFKNNDKNGAHELRHKKPLKDNSGSLICASSTNEMVRDWLQNHDWQGDLGEDCAMCCAKAEDRLRQLVGGCCAKMSDPRLVGSI